MLMRSFAGALCACLVAVGAVADDAVASSGMTSDLLLQLATEDGRLRLPRGYRDGSLAWSPDGRYLFYSQRLRNPRSSPPRIVRVDTHSGERSTFANGDFVVFSPDGRRVALGEGAELRVAEVGSDYALRSTRVIAADRSGALGATRVPAIAWSPDSTRVTFVSVTAAVRDPADPPRARYASRFELRMFDTRTNSDRRLYEATGVGGGIGSVAWSTNDQLLIAVADGAATADARTRIAYLDVDSNDLNTLVENPGVIAGALRPLLSPDRRWLSFWRDDASTAPVQLGYGLELRGLGEDGASTRVPRALYADGPIQWRAGSSQLYFTCKSAAFTANLCVVDAATTSTVDVRSFVPTEDIEWFALSADGRSLAWRSRDVYDVERVRIIDLSTGAQRLVSEERLLPAETAIAQVKPIAWHSFDGLRIAGLLVEPLGYVPGQRYPLIVDVHGGPNGGIRTGGSLLNATPLEWQLWAAKGYAVLVADYRESGIYAPDNRYTRRTAGHYLFDDDAADIVAGARFLVDIGVADPDRLAIIGHSHGSSVTNWLLTRTQCFAAAVSKEGRTDWRAMRPGWERLYEYYFDASATQLPSVLARHSALLYASRVRTPVLYINGQYGLGVTEGREYVEAIQRSGVTARWLSLADEGHVIQSGEHMKHMLAETLTFLETALARGHTERRDCAVLGLLDEPFIIE